jgi:hypothetical protein
MTSKKPSLQLVKPEPGAALGPIRKQDSADYIGPIAAPGLALPLRTANAHLPVLPDPLRLIHGPLLVTLHWWGANDVVADLPACAIHGEGETDTAALEDLADVLHEWAQGIAELGGEEKLGGALLRQWKAFTAMVDVSRL